MFMVMILMLLVCFFITSLKLRDLLCSMILYYRSRQSHSLRITRPFLETLDIAEKTPARTLGRLQKCKLS